MVGQYLRHPHGEKVETFVIERFEDIATYRGIVGTRVSVVAEIG